ncbi:hypothetical protein [Desulfotomaculum sp. 1211_IL3151]|uniref:hypothetical protein n=1 Tax=Desulfotomaculum sp. 1211_IL3151 TaxID=3084055 RepID=UPI002FDAA149
MSPITCTLTTVFILTSLTLFLLLGLSPFSMEQNPLKKRRLILVGTKLRITERITIHFATLFRQTRCTLKKFLIMILLSAAGSFIAGILLLGSTGLAAVMSACVLPAPYFYLVVKSSSADREEIEGLENAMSIITNAYAGNDDIIKAVELYVEEKNRYIPLNLRIPSPFDEFVSEIRLINPNVEHGLYRLSAKIKNQYFSEWVKALILCHNDRRLKFALFPIIKAMNDAKAMQIESDGMMVKVWRDYLMTAGLMFAVIPMMRFANKEWFFLLTQTAIGKLLIILMMVIALTTACYVMKATKPSNR